MITNEDLDRFLNEIEDAIGEYTNSQIGDYFAEIMSDLFERLGFQTQPHKSKTSHFDFYIRVGNDWKLVEVKKRNKNSFHISEEEKDNVNYLIAIITYNTSNYKEYEYAFLTNDDLKTIKLYKHYKENQKEIYIPDDYFSSFDGFVEQIEDYFGLEKIRIDEDEFYSHYDLSIVEKTTDTERIKQLGEDFVEYVLEDNGIKIKNMNEENRSSPFDLKDLTNNIRIEVKTSTSYEYHLQINFNDFDVLIILFADTENRKVYYRIFKNREFRNDNPIIYASQCYLFNETQFISDYERKI